MQFLPAQLRAWLGSVLASLALCLPTFAQTAAPLRVVGSSDPPYRSFQGEDGGGLYYELLKEAARRLGWALQFSEVPSARAFLMMEQGEADLMMGPLRSLERERFLHYSRIELPAEDKCFYTRSGARPIAGMQDLQGRTLAVHRGKRYGAEFDQAAASTGLLRTEVNDYRIALEMLARERVDVVLIPERQARALLGELKLALLRQPFCLKGETPYLVLSRRSLWLGEVARLERSFQAMQQDGSWKRILERY
jgi:polar amino acid transport system substrate-binding protein